MLRLSDFDYPLPKPLIAQYPCVERAQSRLLLLERATNKISHRHFSDIVEYFSAGDCLVLNNTRVIWARIIGRREKSYCRGGGKQELFLIKAISQDTYRVLAKPARKLTVGTKIYLDNDRLLGSVIKDEGMSKVVRFNNNVDAGDIWQRFGQVPLPPYIKRRPEELDRQRYQTVFAEIEGATAAATAGLHFTRELLEIIRAKGVNIVYLTLHISYGTFAPVKSEDIRKHKMHQEYFILPRKTAEIINQTRAMNKKVFAVGTTSIRVLETCAQRCKQSNYLLEANRGWTDLFILPPYRFKAVDCLLTNFHFPKSTLLMLVSAFADRQLILQAYQEGIDKRYRFFSYGDAMLII